jgi:hypothetical protein
MLILAQEVGTPSVNNNQQQPNNSAREYADNTFENPGTEAYGKNT